MSADMPHNSVLCRSLLLVASCVAYAGGASADMATAMVGSVGIVDAKDVGEIATDGVSATLSFSQPGQQEAVIRYPLTHPALDSDGVNDTTLWKLTVRYQDGDPPTAQTQRILVHLKELALLGPSTEPTTVVTFDSDVTDPAGAESDWQRRTVSGCHPFDRGAAYFLEAIFTSGATPVAPLVRLGGMVVEPSEVSVEQPPVECEQNR
jgi:hypothetical protein